MRSIAGLLADLVAEAAMDQDAGLEEWGAGTRRIYDEIIRRFEAGERLAVALRERIGGLPDHPWIPGVNFKDGVLMAALERAEGKTDGHEDRPAHAEVRTVPGRQDPAGEVGGADLPALRRVAADPGAAGTSHHIMTGAAMLMAPTGDPADTESFFLAQWCLWSCGPCRMQGGGRSENERAEQIAAHLKG